MYAVLCLAKASTANHVDAALIMKFADVFADNGLASVSALQQLVCKSEQFDVCHAVWRLFNEGNILCNARLVDMCVQLQSLS